MATPAQVANDMAASGQYWARRDKHIAATCDDAARLIRAYLAGAPVDGRTYAGLFSRLVRLERYDSTLKGYPNFHRAREVLMRLRGKALS